MEQPARLRSRLATCIGVRAVGMVSLKWWQDLLDDFKANLPAARTSRHGNAWNSWLAAMKVIEQDIIPVLSRDIEERLAQGQWGGFAPSRH